MYNALHILRDADIWLTTKKVAIIVGRDVSWVQKNKNKFDFKRPKSRNLVFELSSALRVLEELQ